MKVDVQRLFFVMLILVLGVTGCDKKPLVTTTDDGLVITEVVIGQGARAQQNSAVSVHYTGWFYDENAPDNIGEKFDSSLDRDRQFEFVLGRGSVIKGWEQGVDGMQVGGKRRLVIPAALAYGSRGAGNKIPPDTTLVFDIELFSVDTLEIIDTRVGDGDEAINGAKVAVHYTGWLYDDAAADKKGAKFDSSVDRGNHFSFVLGAKRVIPGWDMGVPGMQVGGSRTLIIPSTMAYGKRGSGKNIPPDSKLIFDVELLEVDIGPLK